MPTNIFVNLHVQDLQKTIQFFTELGFTFNPQFTDENATCMIVAPNIFVMLLVKPFFKTFIADKDISEPNKIEVINAISFNLKHEVDDIVNKAVSLGATEYNPADDKGFMYTRSFQDLDGHLWEAFWMDTSNIQ